MKKKTQKVHAFLDGLHRHITLHPQFRKKTEGWSESQIQTEIRPLIIGYLEKYFSAEGFVDSVAKAHQSFYWEGQEGVYGKMRETTFETRNYPDFIVTSPYVVAIEYKQSASGSLVKHGIGQSIMHTLSDEFDFVYLLFHDESSRKRIKKSAKRDREKGIIERMWKDFNVRVKFV